MTGITRREAFTIAVASGLGATTILAATADISCSKSDAVSRPSTNWRAMLLRHCLTLRWRVLSCPGGKAPGMLSCKRRPPPSPLIAERLALAVAGRARRIGL